MTSRLLDERCFTSIKDGVVKREFTKQFPLRGSGRKAFSAKKLLGLARCSNSLWRAERTERRLRLITGINRFHVLFSVLLQMRNSTPGTENLNARNQSRWYKCSVCGEKLLLLVRLRLELEAKVILLQTPNDTKNSVCLWFHCVADFHHLK